MKRIEDMVLRFVILILIPIFAGGAGAAAQDREYIYDHFNVSNGLISDMVHKILVDREGHAWLTTYNGLQKYNGYEFVTYTSNPDLPGTLNSSFVDNIYEDRDGDLIVVLEDGIDIYNKYTEGFTSLVKDVPFRDIRRDEISRLSSALQDRSGSIWVNCNNQVIRIDSTKRGYLGFQDGFSGRFVLNMDSTCLWIITDLVLKKYDLAKNLLTITPIEDIPAPEQIYRLNTIFYDSRGICWIGTTSGLFVLDTERLRFLDPGAALPHLDQKYRKNLSQDITAIYEDYRSDLWVASGTRMQRIVRSTGNIQILQHEFENPNSLIEEQITGIYGNQTGMIWVTYLNEGITRINIRTNDFRSFRFRPGLENSLGGKTVRSIYQDDQGYLWLGLYNDGLDRIHPVNGSISHFKNRTGDGNTICSNYIPSLLMDHRQRLWVGSHDNGLCYTDQPYSDNPVFRVPEFLNTHDEIYHLQEDKLGRIWIGTRNGLGVFDYDSNEFHQLLPGYNVQSFIIDDHTIWIASWNYGLSKLAFSGQQFRSAIPVFDSVESKYHSALSGDRGTISKYKSLGGPKNCISIYLDNQDNIWLGTYDQGLVKAMDNGKEIAYTIYGTRDGAPGNSVYGVLGDDDGQIWISTQHGLGKFDPETKIFENYYREDGLLSNYFMWKSYFKAADGALFFGSVDGCNMFYPDLIENDSIRPRIIISELRVHNQLVKCGDTVQGDLILDRHIAYQDTLVLNHRNRDFSLRYYSTGHVYPQKLIYAHMLVNYNNDWVITSSENRMASYNNLDPGTYLFRVRTTDHTADWAYPYIEKTIIVLPPWWKTRTVIILYLVLIAGLIFLIANTLVRFLAVKQELKYNEKLHQSKLMFFTNISHEFKAPLSLIKAPLDDILNESDLTPHDRKNLQVARKNADNLLNLVDELMEFRKTDTGNSRLKAEQLDLSSFIGEMTSQFECVAEQKGVHFYYHIPDDPVPIWVDRKKFQRIINNLLENALKYTEKEGLVTLSLITSPGNFSFKPVFHTLHVNQVREDLEYIGILVSDTGLGISRDSLPRIFDRFYQIEAEKTIQHIGSGIGLALVKNLVLMHQGEIRVASERGVGTEILVLLPLGNRHLNKEELTANMTDPPPQSMVKQDQVPAKQIRSKDPLPEDHSRPSILLVEDLDSLREFLKDHLSEEYQIWEASHGKEGLQLLSKHIPDLIITDWIMPEMDGASFIKEIRTDERIGTIPIILLTAKDEFRDRQKGLELGADQVIPKPFNMHLLKFQVRSTIENHRYRMRKYSVENMENLVRVHDNMDAQFIETVERSIRDQIRDTDLNAGTIARDIGISRTSLYEKIKSISGHTIGEYIQKTRLKRAVKLMLYEGVSVSEVYVMVGFSSSSYFIRLFKKYYKTTPGEYIKNYLKAASN